MLNIRQIFAAALTLITLSACGSADVTTEDSPEIGKTTSALPVQACANEYYSDATYTVLVGEWTCTCNSGCYQWGKKTAFKAHWCEDCGRPNPNLP